MLFTPVIVQKLVSHTRKTEIRHQDQCFTKGPLTLFGSTLNVPLPTLSKKILGDWCRMRGQWVPSHFFLSTAINEPVYWASFGVAGWWLVLGTSKFC